MKIAGLSAVNARCPVTSASRDNATVPRTQTPTNQNSVQNKTLISRALLGALDCVADDSRMKSGDHPSVIDCCHELISESLGNAIAPPDGYSPDLRAPVLPIRCESGTRIKFRATLSAGKLSTTRYERPSILDLTQLAQSNDSHRARPSPTGIGRSWHPN